MVLVACSMAACPAQSQQAAGPVSKEQSGMRTAVPLVRPLDPNDSGPIELEFDVPAQAADASPPVFIGLRVTGNDPTAVADLADRLRAAGIGAAVRLSAVGPSRQDVTLLRSQWISRSEARSVALAADGLVPGLFATTADFGSMQAAGLLAPGAVYKELAFADTPHLPAGRYRLALRFMQHREVMSEAKAELLVAYTAKGK